MDRTSISEKDKIRVLTLENATISTFTHLRHKDIKNKKAKYRLSTNLVNIQYPTTNGFRYSELNFTHILPEPEFVLQSFNTRDDLQHEFILKAKSTYHKLGSELQSNGFSVESAKIVETIFFDNETKTEFTFDIEINLSCNLTFEQLIRLEDKIYEELETELIGEFKGEMIELSFSLYTMEENPDQL